MRTSLKIAIPAFLLLVAHGGELASQEFKTQCGPGVVSLRDDAVKVNDKAFFMLSAKWPHLTVFVCWENPTADDEADRKMVKEAVSKTWQKYSRLTFKGWGKCDSETLGVRILIEDSGPHTKGLGQFMATEVDAAGNKTIQKNNMVLNFSFKNWRPACTGTREQCVRTIAIHEFGHAIGFAHEHNRADTPGECTEPPQGTTPKDKPLTPWDLRSAMNYCNPDDRQEVLSDCDIAALQEIYLPPP